MTDSSQSHRPPVRYGALGVAKRVLGAFAVLLALPNCISTNTAGFRSSSIAADAHFNGVLIYVNSRDLVQRQQTEDTVADAFIWHSIRARSSLQIFPPPDSYTTEAMTAKLNEMGIDTYLIIDVDNERKEVVSTGAYTHCASSYGSLNCNTFDTNQEQHTLGISLKLQTLDGKVIWVGTSKGEGRGLLGSAGLSSAMASQISGNVAPLYVTQPSREACLDAATTTSSVSRAGP
jgi:hypothetical protein